MYIDPVAFFLLEAGVFVWVISIWVGMYREAKSPPDVNIRMKLPYRDMGPPTGPKDFMHYHQVYNALIHGVGTTGHAELRHRQVQYFAELYTKKEEKSDWIYAGTVADDDEAQRAIDYFLLHDRT